MNALRDVVSLHRDLYEKALAEAAQHSSMSAPSIKTYAKKFQASLPPQARHVALKTLLTRLDSSRILLFGDFHTLKQSQLALVRLLHAYRLFQPKRPIVLALEMFKGRDTKYVRQYLSGAMSEQEFLKTVRYESDWGFPWKNYKPILEFARRHGIKVCGLNTDLGGKEALAKRDRYAAQQLLQLAKSQPKALVVSLIGEFHLADDHLPFALKRELRKNHITMDWMRVVTNVDKYFFSLPPATQQSSTDYLYLKSDLYSIQNTPPWIKWQSYTMWEELRSVNGINFEGSDDDLIDEYYTEESFDLDYQLVAMMRDLMPVLGLNVSKEDQTGLHVLHAPCEATLRDFQERWQLSGAFFRSLVERLSLEGFAYVAPHRAFLVNEVSFNNLAQIVGYHLFYVHCQKLSEPLRSEDLFVRRTLATLASTLVSKIVNPRRSNYTLNDYTRLLYATARKRLTGLAHRKRETAKRLIDFVSKARQGKAVRLEAWARYDDTVAFEFSVALGSLLGELAYNHCIRQPRFENPWQTFFTIGRDVDSEQERFFRQACSVLLEVQ